MRSTAKVLPGMSLVWTGLFGITAFMGANLALGGFATRWPAWAAAVRPAATADRQAEAVPHGVPSP